jgi:hypothetical protein
VVKGSFVITPENMYTLQATVGDGTQALVVTFDHRVWRDHVFFITFLFSMLVCSVNAYLSRFLNHYLV